MKKVFSIEARSKTVLLSEVEPLYYRK